MFQCIAVTGGIAEGKSTVLSYLREIGAKTASADDMAREAMREPKVREAIRALGFDPDDRSALRDQLVKDTSFRRELNRLIHPHVMLSLANSGAEVVEVPLLIEACLPYFFRRIWCVTCGPEVQHERLTQRLGDPQIASKLIGSQLPTRAKSAFAHRIIRTNQDALSVKRYVTECYLLDRE
jgi:dephospho-CoA kinase